MRSTGGFVHSYGPGGDWLTIVEQVNGPDVVLGRVRGWGAGQRYGFGRGARGTRSARLERSIQQFVILLSHRDGDHVRFHNDLALLVHLLYLDFIASWTAQIKEPRDYNFIFNGLSTVQ